MPVSCHVELQQAGLTWVTLTWHACVLSTCSSLQANSMKHAHHQQTQQAGVSSLTDLAKVELSKYMAAPCQPRASDLLTWWHDNMARFPYSVRPLDVTWRLLQRACLVNVSSAPLVTLLMTSETCLLTENLERLVFLNANLMWNCVNVNDEQDGEWWMEKITMMNCNYDDEW